MNRRRFLVALAIILPVVIFIAAKTTASWRPVIIGSVNGADSIQGASERYLLVGANTATTTLFNLKTGTHRFLDENEGLTSEGAWKWKIDIEDRVRVRLRLREADGPTLSYEMPDAAFRFVRDDMTPQYIRVAPATNRVELLFKNRYYRWNFRSRQLERNLSFGSGETYYRTVTRDGDAAISADVHEINVASTRSRGLVKSVSLVGVQAADNAPLLSRFGSYAIYNGIEEGDFLFWQVVNARTGRALWKFELEKPKTQFIYPIIAPDEKFIALPQTSSRIWRIRDLETGAILRTLPLLPGAQYAEFSPDGATLYSVSNGNVYRQRAR